MVGRFSFGVDSMVMCSTLGVSHNRSSTDTSERDRCRSDRDRVADAVGAGRPATRVRRPGAGAGRLRGRCLAGFAAGAVRAVRQRPRRVGAGGRAARRGDRRRDGAGRDQPARERRSPQGADRPAGNRRRRRRPGRRYGAGARGRLAGGGDRDQPAQPGSAPRGAVLDDPATAGALGAGAVADRCHRAVRSPAGAGRGRRRQPAAARPVGSGLAGGAAGGAERCDDRGVVLRPDAAGHGVGGAARPGRDQRARDLGRARDPGDHGHRRAECRPRLRRPVQGRRAAAGARPDRSPAGDAERHVRRHRGGADRLPGRRAADGGSRTRRPVAVHRHPGRLWPRRGAAHGGADPGPGAARRQRRPGGRPLRSRAGDDVRGHGDPAAADSASRWTTSATRWPRPSSGPTPGRAWADSRRRPRASRIRP